MKIKTATSLGLSILMLSSMALSVSAYGSEQLRAEVYQISPRYTTVRTVDGYVTINGNNAIYNGTVSLRHPVFTSVTATLQKQVAYGVWASVASISRYGSTASGVSAEGSATVERGYYYRVYVSVNAGSEYASCFSSEQYCG